MIPCSLCGAEQRTLHNLADEQFRFCDHCDVPCPKGESRGCQLCIRVHGRK